MEFDFMKEIPVEILNNTSDSKVNQIPLSLMTTNRTGTSKVGLNDQQQTVNVSCLTSQNLHTNLMDNDVSPDVCELLEDVMNVIYEEVPRSVLQSLINTDNMDVTKGGSPSLQQRPVEAMDAQYFSSQDEQYHVQGTGSCSRQTFAKDIENDVLAIGVGRNGVSSDLTKTYLLPEGTGCASHSTPSSNVHITRWAYNDLIAYLKGPGHSTGGHFEGPIKVIQKSSIPDGTETPLLQKTVGIHATTATDEGRSGDKHHQAGPCDDALVRRREQNRKAAKKCRDKRLKNLKNLEEKVKLLLQQRNDLTEVRQRLLQVRTSLNQNRGDNRIQHR